MEFSEENSYWSIASFVISGQDKVHLRKCYESLIYPNPINQTRNMPAS